MFVGVAELHRTTSLDCAVAEEFFGWKWIACLGTPIRSTEGYPKEIMCRQFHPPETLTDQLWIDHWSKRNGRESDGTEPLAYCYGSSQGLTIVPHFSGNYSAVATLEKLIRKRKLWDRYRKQLWVQVTDQTDDMDIGEERLADASCEDRCISALAIIDSRFIDHAP